MSDSMTLTVPGFRLPGWEVIHVYQKENKNDWHYKSMVLLLRRTVSAEEPFAVCKIVTHAPNMACHDADIMAMIPPHPNIIMLYSSHAAVPHPGKTSLIFEYCADEDLLAFARSARERIPESFFWHVLHQSFLALIHLDRYQIHHGDLHVGNLFLRPVEGDTYPDVVFADFEYAEYQAQLKSYEWTDLQRLGNSMQGTVVIIDETLEGLPYSQELTDFVRLLFRDKTQVQRLPDLVEIAKKMAYGDNNAASPRMPAWMIAYFAELKSKAVPRPSNSKPT
ncbi:hypothetical protein MMC07_003871 [Pseudocyphellaria aurata]|nr:hypothetical protein [Pseudocyphellaria aurata]